MGKTDDAINLYLHRERSFVSPQMEDGKRIHAYIATHIEKNNCLPAFLPTLPLVKPLCEHKVLVPYNELISLSSIFDCIDTPSLYEFKTGVMDSLEWSGEYQIPFYFFVCDLLQIKVDKAYLIHYNQYLKGCDFVIIWNNEKHRRRAKEMIDTLGPEIWHFFNDRNIL